MCENKCETIELNTTQQTIKDLVFLADVKIKPLLDPCSYAIFTESTKDTYDELTEAIGQAMVNSVLVDAAKYALEQNNDTEQEDTRLP